MKDKGMRYEKLLSRWAAMAGLAVAILTIVQGEASAYWYMYARKWVFGPEETATVGLSAEGEKSIALASYKIDPSWFGEPDFVHDMEAKAPKILLKRWTVKPPARAKQTYASWDVPIPTTGKGLYLVTAQAGKSRRSVAIAVTDLALVAKQSGKSLSVWATDITSGKPLPGQTVRVQAVSRMGEEEQEQPAPSSPIEGVTDSDGLAKFELAKGGTNLVSARSGDSVAYCYTHAEMYSEPERVYLYTERPVYRPKQTVYFKGVARRDLGHEWETLAGQEVTVSITDPEGDEVLRETFTTNDFGSFAGSLELSAAPLLGWYSILATIGESTSYASFTVEEYRKPEFAVKVRTPQNVYFPGDKVEFEVTAAYYFGAPVAGAEVKYFVYSGYHWWYTYEDDLESEFAREESSESEGEDEYYGFGELLYEGEAVTGPDGKARIVVAAKSHDTDRTYTIDARVTDKSRREQRGSGACVVAPAQIRPDVSVDRWVAKPMEKITVSLQTIDVLSDAGLAAKVDLLVRRTWWTRTKSGSEERWVEKFEDVSAQSIQTDASGRATLEIEVPVKDGEYQVVASVRDARNRRATETAWFMVAAPGARSSWVERASLRIESDKSRYVPGETARVVITGSKADSYVLVTVEGFSLFECFVTKLLGCSAYLEIPVKEEYRPNVYVKACSVADMSFLEDSSGVRVSPEGKYLTVQVAPDRESHGPGETATYTLSTVAQDGAPVSAEVSLGIVDEAIYAIRPDQTPDIRRFFYSNKENSVRTSHSFAHQYAGGQEKGEPEEPGQAEIEVRKRFEDTAYWNPFIVTDGAGQATVSLQLPDNLTTWRATAIAATKETAVGLGRHKEIVTKPLVARLITPRFLVQDDTVTISGIVHNYTAQAQDVEVSLEAEGAELLSASAQETVRLDPEGQRRFDWQVKVERIGEATLTLKARGSGASDALALTLPVNPFGVRQVDVYSARAASETSRVFNLPEGAQPDTASLRVSLAPSLAACILQSMRDLAQYPYGCIEQTMSCFLPDVLLTRAMRDLNLKDDWLDRNLQDMVEVGLSKIYAKQLESGGWGWTEQDEIDAYWTNYVVYGLLMAQMAGFEVKKDRLDLGLAALRQAVADAPDDLKAEVLHTLSIADGRAWHEHTLRAFSAIKEDIKSPRPKRSANELDASLAFAVLALSNMGDLDRAKECCGLLSSRAKTTADSASWGGDQQGDWYYGTQNTETTAWALRALLAADPESSLAPKAVRWLMQQRSDKGWRSTKDTCAVLLAMIDYLEKTREMEADYLATIGVNGREVEKRQFTKDDLFKPEVHVDVARDLLKAGANVVTVEKDGDGTLYWTGALSYYLPADKARPSHDGLKIEKLYLKAESVRKKEPWGADWAWKYSSAKDGVAPGDLVFCKLVIRAASPQDYVLIADPIPSGCEFRKDEDYYGYWWEDWWYGQREYHDDHIAFLSSSVYPGKRVITYYLRAETPGEFHISPAEISAMYAPESRANSQAITLKVRE